MSRTWFGVAGAWAIAILLCAGPAGAQVFSNMEVGKNNALADSLKHSHYPYALPIWGDKATARGFNLPFSAGLSVQYIGQRSDLVIDNLLVGFNGGTMHDLDNIIRFDKAKSATDGISIRPDVWVFPFLNVYGIFAQSKGSTEVGYGLWLPDSVGNDQLVASSETKVEFDATTAGFGITPTIGIGGGWLALDMNFTWTDVPQLDAPASAFVFDPRVGKSFKLGGPDQNINFWVGGFRLKINTGTSGSIPLADALPIDQWQASVDQGKQQVAARDAQVEAWWNSLTPTEQANPLNQARYAAAKAAIERAAGFFDAAGQAVANASSSTVEYSLDKRPEDMWNVLVGGQYQLSKSWMFRGEVGFLTSRKQVLVGAQYRFGI
jgi:hypothetical protein